MKRIIISSIVLTLVAGGGLFIFNNNAPKIAKPVVKVELVKAVMPEVIDIVPNDVKTKTIEIPANEIKNTESNQQTITNTTEERIIPTFDELQLKYTYIRGSSELVSFTARQKSQRPDKFTPENIEASFEYINNYFGVRNGQSDDEWYRNIFPEKMSSFTW